MTDDFAFTPRDTTLPAAWPAPELTPEERAVVERFWSSPDGLADHCYQWPRECGHWDDLDCLALEQVRTGGDAA